MAVDVLIGGLDSERTRELEAAVRHTIVELRANDVTTVAVLPSDARDRWDVGVRRADGWSVTWFDAPLEDLLPRVTGVVRASTADR